MNKKIYFPKRILEPTTMELEEMKIFEQISRANYKQWTIPIVEDIKKLVASKKPDILDIGCGPGLLSKALAEGFPGGTISGVDISSQAIKMAKQNCKGLKNVKFLVKDAYRLPFKNNTFDVIVCKDTFHHFKRPLNVLREMVRILKPQGIIYLQDLRRDLPQYILKEAIPPNTPIKKLQYYSARASFTKEEIAELIKKIKPKSFSITTKKVSVQLAKYYNKFGINADSLKRVFQTRYVAIVLK